MTNSKKDNEILDSILKAKMRGFRRVDTPVQAESPATQSGTPDSAAFRSKAGSFPEDARVTARAAEILRSNLGVTTAADDVAYAAAALETVPASDVVIASVRPEGEALTDEPTAPKAVVIQKSTKKILFRQG